LQRDVKTFEDFVSEYCLDKICYKEMWGMSNRRYFIQQLNKNKCYERFMIKFVLYKQKHYWHCGILYIHE